MSKERSETIISCSGIVDRKSQNCAGNFGGRQSRAPFQIYKLKFDDSLHRASDQCEIVAYGLLSCDGAIKELF